MFINNSTDKYLLILEVEFSHCSSSNHCAKMQVKESWSSMLDLPLIQDYLQYQVDFYCTCHLDVNSCLDQSNVCFMLILLFRLLLHVIFDIILCLLDCSAIPCDIWPPLSRNAKKKWIHFCKDVFPWKGLK